MTNTLRQPLNDSIAKCRSLLTDGWSEREPFIYVHTSGAFVAGSMGNGNWQITTATGKHLTRKTLSAALRIATR